MAYISPGLPEKLAPGQFHFLATGFKSLWMQSVEDARHSNLLLILGDLAREHGEHGSIQRLAAAVACSHSQISQLKTRAKHSKTGKPRNIGPAMARKIEQASGKEPGWLDYPHGDTEGIESRIDRLIDAALDRRLNAGLSEIRPFMKRKGAG